MDTDLLYLHFQTIRTFRLQIPHGQDPSSFSRTSFTLDCVALLLQKYIHDVGTKPLTVIIQPSIEDPCCDRAARTVYLKTTAGSWCQAAYQFAHELCHYAIPSTVPSSLRWLEESICELASLYFLPMVTDYWKAQSIPYRDEENHLYSDHFAAYAKARAAKSKPCDFHDPTVIADLEKNCYQREKNRYIALLLMPIFTDYPELWSAVPLLCRIPPLNTLHERLALWQSISPQKTYPGFAALLRLFS